MAVKSTKARVKREALAVPQSEAECNRYIERLGNAQRERTRIETEMNDEMAALKSQFEERAKPFRTEAELLSEAIQAFCEANRDRLTRDRKVKFHKFGSGEVNWRVRPPRVSIRGTEAVLEAIKALGLTKFIRVKEEINKDAMLADAEKASSISGVTIGSEAEDFTITPFETQLEEVA